MKRSLEKPNNIKLINKAKTEYFRGGESKEKPAEIFN